MEHRNKVIEGILQGKSDNTIAKEIGMSIAQLRMRYHCQVFPKRKQVLDFIICYHLSELADDKEINLSSLSNTLNNYEIPNQVGNTWNTSKVRSYLRKKGVTVRRTYINGVDLLDLAVSSDDFYSHFNVYPKSTIDIESYFKKITLENSGVSPNPIENTENHFLANIGIGIRSAIKNGSRTVAEITKFLNDNGYTNKSGKSIGRWSVKMYMESLGIAEPTVKGQWGNEEKQYLIGKIATTNKHTEITTEHIEGWVKELETADYKIVDKPGLVSSVSHLRIQHNKIAKENSFQRIWFPKIDFAVNVVLRHKLASRSEVAEYFGFTTMTAQRYLDKLDYDIEEQYYLRFRVLYNQYLKENEVVVYSSLANWLNKSYLKSPRGRRWTYLIVQYTIEKMRELDE